MSTSQLLLEKMKKMGNCEMIDVLIFSTVVTILLFIFITSCYEPEKILNKT